MVRVTNEGYLSVSQGRHMGQHVEAVDTETMFLQTYLSLTRIKFVDVPPSQMEQI